MSAVLPLCSRCKKDILAPALGVDGLPLKSCLKCYNYMKDINKRRRKEYNKKAYQKRKTKKDTKATTEDTKAPEKVKAEETKAPEKVKAEETKAPEKEKATDRVRLTKKSFTLNDKKYTFIETEKNKPRAELMAVDRLIISKIYKLYKAVNVLYNGNRPPALASPALDLLGDYLEEATTAHGKGTPWAVNNYKEIKAIMKEIKEYLII